MIFSFCFRTRREKMPMILKSQAPSRKDHDWILMSKLISLALLTNCLICLVVAWICFIYGWIWTIDIHKWNWLNVLRGIAAKRVFKSSPLKTLFNGYQIMGISCECCYVIVRAYTFFQLLNPGITFLKIFPIN